MRKILTSPLGYKRCISNIVPQQSHENKPAKIVLTHEPGIESLLGSLHSLGALFEKPVSLDLARKHHKGFRDAMTEMGVEVLTVREVLSKNCERDLRARLGLEDLAVQVMRYKFEDPHDQHAVDHDEEEIQRSFPVHHAMTISGEAREYYLSDEYKRKCISAMGVQDIIDLILCSPTVQLRPSSVNTPLRIKRINTRPTLNLCFTRDQQLVTYKGLVLNRMGSPQRLNETKIMDHVFKVLGIEVLGAIREPGICEGGDFFAMGPDLSMIGVGLRTNQFAVDTMMKNDWFGTRRVAVVRDCFDLNQQRMHLDTIFNICGDNVCTLLDAVIGDSKIKRLVTEYTQDSNGKYHITQKDIEFSNYLKKEGYHVIPVTNTQQEAYGLNYLNLGNGNIISVDEDTARSMLRNRHFNGTIKVIPFDGMTTMYGSVHCCSQVLVRNEK